MTEPTDHAEVKELLWKEMGEARMGMLGVRSGEPRHFAPMTPFCERDDRRIWFFTRRDNDIARAGRGGGEALFIISARDGKFQASIAGQLSERLDPVRRDKFWNPVVAAWYPDGKDDPNLTMLCFDCTDAEVWHSEAGALRFAFEIARANLTGKLPDPGEKTELGLR
jgi:general stress protein 26